MYIYTIKQIKKNKMKKLTLLEKMEYLEKKFNAPMDIIMKSINFCTKNNICITEINLNK